MVSHRLQAGMKGWCIYKRDSSHNQWWEMATQWHSEEIIACKHGVQKSKVLDKFLTICTICCIPGPEEGFCAAFQECLTKGIKLSAGRFKQQESFLLREHVPREISMWVKKYYIFSELKSWLLIVLKMPILTHTAHSQNLWDRAHLQ